MRLAKLSVLVPALALLAMGCMHGPVHGHGPYPCAGWDGHGCGQASCTYRSRCFSEGAVRSNDGVCQACAGGKWVQASGCSEGGGMHDGCGMMDGKDKPCGCHRPDHKGHPKKP